MKNTSNPTPPLIQQFDTLGVGHLADEFIAIAKNIEEALRQMGAIPGKDYSIKDLANISAPIVAAMVKTGRIDEYDYPAKRVIARNPE
ncbi:MAG: hypothetical protein RLZZ505_488 [Verrucomicrobiota bacterium]|jgi:hypothetical protein